MTHTTEQGNTPAPFRRMDESTPEQWAAIKTAFAAAQPQVADRVLRLLRMLEEPVDGFATNQLVHCLQTATRAERAGADGRSSSPACAMTSARPPRTPTTPPSRRKSSSRTFGMKCTG
jgi:hypothetical protein